MTDAHKKAADIIVEAYKEKEGRAHNINGFLSNLQDKAPISDLRYASHILLHKGILMSIDGVVRENLMLSDKGWSYESFDKLIEEENAEKQLIKDQITSATEANQSVKKVNGFFIAVLAATIVSAISTCGTFILEVRKELNQPKTQQPQIVLQLRDTTLFLEKINPSTKTLTERSFNKDTSNKNNIQQKKPTTE